MKSEKKSYIEYFDLVVPLEGTWIEIGDVIPDKDAFKVVPLEGTWIEICPRLCSILGNNVVPLEGTWIEIRLAIRPQ